jgi:uncharacterized protein YjbI with pentapeptide repeats
MAVKAQTRIPTPPDLPALEHLTAITDFSMLTAQDCESIKVDGSICADQKSAHIKIRESILTSIDLTATEIDFMQANDVLFETCDIANARWNWLTTERVVFSSCRLLGFKAIECAMESARFDKCLMQLSQFRYSKLKGAYFEDCNLREADFSGADLTGASFVGCDLTGASFSDAKCSGLDVRSAILDGLLIGPASLIGIIINPAQAADIVKLFGVTVLNEHEALPKTRERH